MLLFRLKITQLNTKIQETTANLNKSQQELKEAIATREAHYNTLKKRIRVMYEYGNSGYLRHFCLQIISLIL